MDSEEIGKRYPQAVAGRGSREEAVDGEFPYSKKKKIFETNLFILRNPELHLSVIGDNNFADATDFFFSNFRKISDFSEGAWKKLWDNFELILENLRKICAKILDL